MEKMETPYNNNNDRPMELLKWWSGRQKCGSDQTVMYLHL